MLDISHTPGRSSRRIHMPRERRIIEDKKRLCAPPPCGISTGLFPSYPTGYPNPSTFPGIWTWEDGSSAVYSGSNLTGWTDLSGQNHPFNQISTSPGPPQVGPVVGGLPSVLFGNGPYCYTTSGTGGNPPPEFFTNVTCWSVFQLAAYEGYGRLIDHDIYPSFALCLSSTGTGVQFIMNYALTGNLGTCFGGSLALGTIYLATGIFDSTTPGSGTGTGTVQLNGTTVATFPFSTPVNGFAQTVYTSQDAGGGSPIDGAVFDQAISANAFSGIQLRNANRYFGNKYSLVVP